MRKQALLAALAALTALATAAPAAAAQPSGTNDLPDRDRRTFALTPDDERFTTRSDSGTPAEPGTPTDCKAQYGRPCYTVRHLQRAYGLDALHRRGIQGQGQTIAVVMPLRHPTVQKDLDRFSARMGIPSTDIEIVERGNPKTADPSDPDESSTAYETSLDLHSPTRWHRAPSCFWSPPRPTSATASRTSGTSPTPSTGPHATGT